MKRPKLSRKRKKKFKKDLYQYLHKDIIENLSFEPRRITDKELNDCYVAFGSVEYWNWIYHRKKVEVQSMYVIFNEPYKGEVNKETGIWEKYEDPIKNSCSNEELLAWYKKHYPNDKLSHHWCKANRLKHN